MAGEEIWVPDKMILVFDWPAKVEIASTSHLAEEAEKKGYRFYPCSEMKTRYAVFIGPNYFCIDTVKIDGSPMEIAGAVDKDALAMVIAVDYIDVVTDPGRVEGLRREREEIEKKLDEIIAKKSGEKGYPVV